ncbi:MAG: hypothetical protein AAFV07_06410, partial [Bacteroidota bacterium]
MHVSRLILACLILALPFWGQGQQFEVLGHWTFDDPVWNESQKGALSLRKNPNIFQTNEGGGIRGGYLHFDRTHNGLAKCPIELDQAATIEFWIRHNADEINLSSRGVFFTDGTMTLGMSIHSIQFQTKALSPAGKLIGDNLQIRLDAQGRRSIGYYLDNNWHHFAIQYDPQTGKKAIWVDGQCPPGFSTTVEERGRLCALPQCVKRLQISDEAYTRRGLYADLDELVVYRGYVPASVIRQHYEVGKSGKGTYVWNTTRKVQNNSQENAFSMAIDPMEYAPEHPAPSLTPVEQLRYFPSPRYRSGHTLRPLYCWIDPIYFSGRFRPNITDKQAIANSVALMEEMGDHWHYSLVLHNDNTIPLDLTTRPGTFMHAWIDLANRRKDLPLALTTFWAQTKVIVDGKRRPPYISSKNLPAEYYLKNARGQFVGPNGQAVSKPAYLSPAYHGELFKRDADIHRRGIKRLLTVLERPIDYINENGEVPPHHLKEELLKMDPTVEAHFKQSRLPSWDVYMSRRKTRLRQNYSQGFLSLPELKNTIFSWYAVDGGPINRFEWEHARRIQTPQNGYYYSTPDFYPRWPSNWEKWRGAWRGFAWLDSCRKVEILAGDKLFSPFVAAGWGRTEKNVRPSQWLGLLKHMGVIGAE